MRKISIINYKGGTGKTTTVVNIAHGLALKGKKVIIIDTDPQGCISHYLGINPDYSLYDLLLGRVTYKKCIVEARENLDVICANGRLFPAEIAMARYKDRETLLMRKLKDLKGYDYVFVDCAPSMNLLNQNALMYTQELFVPVSMEYLSLVGVKQLLNNVKILNKIFKKNIVISRIVPTFYDKRNKKSTVVLESLKRVFNNSLTTPIRSSVSLSEAPGFKKTIFEYNPKSSGAEDYKKLINEVHNGDTKTV
jgi:chromosome partitioning protein